MIDGRISVSEIADVYIPLAERLGARFLGDDPPLPVPVVAVVGSVAVGKSTTARALREVLARARPSGRTSSWWRPTVSCSRMPCSTRVGLTMRKGFPESYDLGALARVPRARASVVPTSSACRCTPTSCYDVVPGSEQVVARPRVLLMEGLALTEPGVAPLVDFVIYLDADERDIRDWFLARFVAMFSEDLLEIA